jgi:peptide subunit release factor 1 (eRF1)
MRSNKKSELTVKKHAGKNGDRSQRFSNLREKMVHEYLKKVATD